MSATSPAEPLTGRVDPAEVAKFEAMAAEWWDPNGKFKPLHMLNPCRLDYVIDQVSAEFGRDPTAPRPFAGLRVLDIGCGGGLLSEPMARLGAAVVGADAAARNIPVARLHAEQSGLAIDYRHATAEDLATAGERFDVVLCDLMMPIMSGMELYDELVKRAPEQAKRVIFLTGGAFTPKGQAFLDQVPNPRLDKPFDNQNLRSIVRERVRGNSE